jgi:hypothetical protein
MLRKDAVPLWDMPSVGLRMVVTAYLFAVAVGVVAAGIIASIWEIAFDEEPQLALLFDANPTLLTPFRVMAVVLSAPATVMKLALWWLIEQPLIGVLLLVVGAVWSFFHGVFILTRVFGFT